MTVTIQARLTLNEALAQAARMTGGLRLHECHIGEDAHQRLAACVQERRLGNVLVVADANTLEAVGDRVHRAVTDAGAAITEHCFGPEPLDATMDRANEVAKAGAEAGAYIAIGAGTLCDLAKQAGSDQDKPVLLYATAASMNGYTSGITALKVNGLKRTIPCAPAAGVYADPGVIAAAPPRMAAAGLADFLSKGSSSSDWRAAHFLRGEDYNEDAMVFYRGVQERVLEHAAGVGRGEPESVSEILEALLLSGLSMLVAGSSSPASGGEHLISHFLDMKQALYGASHDLHGVQVGVATIHCLTLWEQILALDPMAIDIDALVAAQPDAATIQAWIEEDWGPIAAEITAQWEAKALDAAGLRAELQRFQIGFDELSAHLRAVYLPSATVRDAIESAGGPTRPEDMNAPLEEYTKALTRARFIRSRFTVLDLAAELGVA